MKKVIINISDEDRVLFGKKPKGDSANVSVGLIGETDKFLAINRVLDLPRLPTIGDRMMEGALSVNCVVTLEKLGVAYPKLVFDNLTEVEAGQVLEYSYVVSKMSRWELWEIMKPFFSAVFKENLGDLLPKMKEISKRMENKADYCPTSEWLVIIAQRILYGRKDLFQYNINLSTRMFDNRENPIDILLMFIKVQREMYPKRNNKLAETFIERFKVLIKNHAELMVKLKIDDRAGSDFFGSGNTRVNDGLRKLKRMVYSGYGGKPFTEGMQTEMLLIMEDYRHTLELVFMYDSDDKAVYERSLCRVNKEIKLSSLEVFYMYDDSSTTRKDYVFSMNTYQASSAEIINSIYIKYPTGQSMNSVYRNGISTENLKEYIGQYFGFDKIKDRNIIRQRELSGGNTIHRAITNGFYDILDSYFIK